MGRYECALGILCDDAVWWWKGDLYGLAGPVPLCDEHAADKDLDDLLEIRGTA